MVELVLEQSMHETIINSIITHVASIKLGEIIEDFTPSPQKAMDNKRKPTFFGEDITPGVSQI